ncbi:hypothetical protein GQX74_002704 [Glossina fuscipes]|nr:hypothetical protein GQX74_002704 [Glossina fuscipes]
MKHATHFSVTFSTFDKKFCLSSSLATVSIIGTNSFCNFIWLKKSVLRSLHSVQDQCSALVAFETSFAPLPITDGWFIVTIITGLLPVSDLRCCLGCRNCCCLRSPIGIRIRLKHLIRLMYPCGVFKIK